MPADDLPAVPRLPSRRGAGARRGPRERALTRDAITAAALDIVDREGLDALTMRTVAHSLGTGAASLYAHVASKEELLELLIERVIGEIQLPEADPDHWEEQIKVLARTIRRVFSRHGDLARASFARIPLGENALRGSEWLIGLMRAAGLRDDVVAFAVDLLPLYVMAICYEESLARGESSPEELAEFIAELGNYFASLPAARFPNVVSLAGALTAGDPNGDERFEFGLEVLIRGVAALGGPRRSAAER